MIASKEWVKDLLRKCFAKKDWKLEPEKSTGSFNYNEKQQVEKTITWTVDGNPTEVVFIPTVYRYGYIFGNSITISGNVVTVKVSLYTAITSNYHAVAGKIMWR